MSVKTYAPNQVKIVMGALPLSGLAEDTFVTLMQTSASNAALTALHHADKSTDGNGAVPVAITDLRGTSLHASDSAWVVKMPDAGYGAKVGNREWTIETGPSINVVGGNT